MTEPRPVRAEQGPARASERGVAIPQRVIDDFVSGDLVKHAPVVLEGDRSKIYRCFMTPESVGQVVDSRFRVDYREYLSTVPRRWDQLRFEYVRPRADHPDDDQLIAEMHLGIVSPERFVLEHRLVQPEFRQRAGVGTALFRRVEEFLQRCAASQGWDVSLNVQTGQQAVVQWLTKLGFTVSEDQQALLQEILEHPDHFELRTIESVDGISKEGCLFRKHAAGHTIADAERLSFSKTYSAKSSTHSSST